MAQVVENIISLIAELPPRDRHKLVDRVIDSGLLCESSEDALVLASRRDEPTTPYRTFRQTLKVKR